MVLILDQLITADSALPKLPKLLKLSKLPIFALITVRRGKAQIVLY